MIDAVGYCWDYLLQLFVLIPTSWPRPHAARGRKYEITNAFLAGAFGISMRISVRVSHVLESWWLVLCALEEHRGMHCKKWAKKELPLYIYICIWEFLLLQGRLRVHTAIFSQCTYWPVSLCVCCSLCVCSRSDTDTDWTRCVCVFARPAQTRQLAKENGSPDGFAIQNQYKAFLNWCQAVYR